MTNPLEQLGRLGQSVWIDVIRRNMLGANGMLEGLIRSDGVAGVTSNPAIFEKAIDDSTDYDDDIRKWGSKGRSPMEIYETLILGDVARAADQFRSIYEKTGGEDGFVSIEVSPLLASNTAGSIAEGRRLWNALGRPNVMVKIPATEEGIPAIGQLLREGVNVNITLLFSLERYAQVLEAYLGALEDRLRNGQPIDRISSVASFFLSRIDTFLDPAIHKILKEGGDPARAAWDLPGTIAISSAKLAYRKWLSVHSSPRWAALAGVHARPQRLLWASTSTKNPLYSDTLYVEPLIGPQTITTMTLETLAAYKDHGRPSARLEEGAAEAQRRIELLRAIGIDLRDTLNELEKEGIRKFILPLEKLLETISRKIGAVQAPPKLSR